ncbi:hypothetical protein PENTCL1PPCAC_696, partial [Pristionchus entomophagus]
YRTSARVVVGHERRAGSAEAHGVLPVEVGDLRAESGARGETARRGGVMSANGRGRQSSRLLGRGNETRGITGRATSSGSRTRRLCK